MIKKEKGITLISLSIAVIIILTITGMIIYSAKDSIYIKNLTNMQNDIANLRDKVSLYYSEYGDIPAKTEYPDVSNLQSAGVLGVNDTGKFLILELENLEGLTLNYGEDYEKYKANDYTNLTDLTDIYIINENSHNIFYVEGIRVKENDETKMYYTDYTEGDTEKVDVKTLENWHEETITEEGKEVTVVTNGVAELKVGDYVNYNPEDGAVTKTYKSSTGTYVSSSVGQDGKMEEGNGYVNTNNGESDGAQNFDISKYNGGWRVLGIDEETDQILLISSEIVETDTIDGKFYLSGQTGYEWGVKELNDICAIFGEGKGASGARSINVDDINKITGYNTETAQYGVGQIYEYGNNVTYKKNLSTGRIAFSGTNGVSYITSDYSTFRYYDEGSNIWKTLEDNKSITVRSTDYYYAPDTLTTSLEGEILGISKDSIEYEMLFERTLSGQDYWLASPFISTYSGNAGFGLRAVKYGGVFISFLFYSDGGDNSADVNRPPFGVRPIVSLESNISIVQKEGTSENPHQIQ